MQRDEGERTRATSAGQSGAGMSGTGGTQRPPAAGMAGDRTGMPGVESALGRDRTLDGDVPADLATNRSSRPAVGQGAPVLRKPEDQTTGDVGGAVDQAKQVAGDVASQAQDKAGQLADQVKQQASSRLSGQIGKASEGLGTVSEVVRSMGDQLREQDQGYLAQVTDQAASQVDRVASYLRGKDVDQLVHDTERFARRQPALFVGSAFALGLLASRFLKSSVPAPSGSGQGMQGMPGRGLGMNAGLSYPTLSPTPPPPPVRPTPPSAPTAAYPQVVANVGGQVPPVGGTTPAPRPASTSASTAPRPASNTASTAPRTMPEGPSTGSTPRV